MTVDQSGSMEDLPRPASDAAFMARTVEAAIRIGLLVLLLAWCFQIVRPFVMPIAWAVILAVLAYPAYRWLAATLGGRDVLAATGLAVLGLILLIVPAVTLTGTLVEFTGDLMQRLEQGTLKVPPPPESVVTWPVVGEGLDRFWSLASVNLEAALHQIEPQLEAVLSFFLSSVVGTGLGLLQFVLSIIIAGVLLAQSDKAPDLARAVGRRLAGEQGAQLVDLAGDTVRSVARGVLGVALIQALLAGLGFLAIGVPGAGLWVLLVLLLAVIQLPTGLILIPIAIYVFTVANTFTAVVFLLWSIFVSAIDNVLKPLLLGRGVRVPMVVIFLGAIGGMLAAGIIGLFVGSVLLAVAYELFRGWLAQSAAPEPEQARAQAAGADPV